MEKTKYFLTLETIRRFIRRNAYQNLKNLLSRIHYADLASILEDLSPEEADQVFGTIPGNQERASAVASMDPERALLLLERMEIKKAVNLLRLIPPDDAAGMLEKMPEETAARFKEIMATENLDNVEDLLTYPEETAGRVMTQEVFSLPADLTVREAIDRLREAGQAEMVFYIYIVDPVNRLVGVVSLRKLLLAKGDASLESIMIDDVISVTPEVDQEEVAHLVARYDLLAIPVTDENHCLLGIVTVDDVIDIIHEEAKEDMYLLAGTSITEIEVSSPLKMTGIRLPWLSLRFAGGCLAFFFIHYLGTQLDAVYLMAALIPLFMAVVGGVGSQAATIVAEQLTLRADKAPKIKEIIGNEIISSSLTALLLSLATGAVVYFFMDPAAALIISVALFAGVAVAAISGSIFPILFHRLGLDPLVITGSVISTILDLISVCVYIGSVYMLLGLR